MVDELQGFRVEEVDAGAASAKRKYWVRMVGQAQYFHLINYSEILLGVRQLSHRLPTIFIDVDSMHNLHVAEDPEAIRALVDDDLLVGAQERYAGELFYNFICL